MEVKSDKVEEVVERMLRARDYAKSDKNSGYLEYRICRSGDTIMIFEKYVDNRIDQLLNPIIYLLLTLS